MDGNDIAYGSESDVAFASWDEEEVVPPTRRRVFVHASTFNTLRAAKSGIDTFDSSTYKFSYNYGKKGHGQRVYKCISHKDCGKRLRLRKDGDVEFKIEHAGQHGVDGTNAKKRGIHGSFKLEVADILLDCGPKKCRKILQERYTALPELSSILPDTTQLKNHKAHLKSSLADGWEIKNIAKLLEWAFPRMCSTRAEFFLHGGDFFGWGDFDAACDAQTFYKLSRDFRHELLVLECFEHAITTENGKKDSCFGLVVTSRQIFRNVLYAHNGQCSDGIIGATDGTYKLHFGGWTLVDFGTYGSHYDRTQYSKTFLPWVYMFVRTEHQVAYTTMFVSVQKYAQLFFGIDLQLAYGSLDRTAGIANAFVEVWPEIILLNCYPHFSRKSRENRSRLKDMEFYETNVLVNIQYLVEARSRKQYNALGKIFLDYWRKQGEGDYADWMQQYYMGSMWGNWFYTAAVPGLTPSQNAIESHHKVIKETCIDSLRASTAVVLNDSLPRVLKHQEDQAIQLELRHFCEGPLISVEVENAQRLLLNNKNYYSVKAPYTKVLTGILFNAPDFLVTTTNIHGAPINRQRAQRYLNSLNGKLPRDITVFKAQLYCLSLYHVRLLHLEKTVRLSATPKFSICQIESIRAKYSCECKTFVHTGWQCCHIIAAMVLQGDISVDGMLKALPVRKPSGGQRKPKGALSADGAELHQFSVDALTREFLRHPLAPINWTVMKEFPISKNDIAGPMHNLLGKVISWAENSGLYFWLLKFSDLRRLQVDCNTLAELVHDAYIHGADITGPIFFEPERTPDSTEGSICV